MKRNNEILANCRAKFYLKAWIQMNEIVHSLKVCRHYVLEWYSSLIKIIESSNKPEMHKYLRTYRIHIEKVVIVIFDNGMWLHVRYAKELVKKNYVI